MFNEEPIKPVEEEVRVERLCDCGWRDYIHWKDRPLR